MTALRNALTLSVIECKIARIRADAAAIESAVTLISELRKLNPMGTPILDLNLAARDLRLAAMKLDQIRAGAEAVG